MAKIPDTQALGERPIPQAQTAISSYRAASGAETAPGEALAQGGAQLEHAADKLWQIAKIEQEKADTTRAEDAFNKLRQKGLELTADEKVGFVHQKGEQIATRPTVFKDYSDLIAEAAKTLGAGLDNDAQREKFKRRADVAIYQFKHDLLNHITKERSAYAEQVTKGTIETEIHQASVRWQDPNAVAMSIERIRAAVNTEADRIGAAPEARAAAMQQNESKVHAAVIGHALASGDYEYAGRWFKQYGDRVDTTTAKAVEKAIADGTQKEIFNRFQREFIDSGRNLESLTSLEKRIAEDSKLDETRKNALLGRVESRRESLIRQQQSANERAERQLERQINAVNSITMMGYEPTTEQMAPLINAAAGTALAPQVEQMVAIANETRKFRQLPPIAQETYLTQLEAAARKDPTKVDVAMVNRFNAIHQNMKREAKENPVGFAVRQGFIDPASPAAQPLDLSKPDQIGPLLASRFELARSVARNYSTDFKPLQPEEVALLTKATSTMAPEDKRAYFGALAKSSAGNIDGYKAMMNQITPDDPVTAAGGMAAARGLSTADAIFRGQAYLNAPKKEDGKPVKGVVVMPAGGEQGKMLMYFNDQTGNAFEGKPGARNIYLQTAQAIYADKIVQAGDFTGNLDTRKWKEAVNQALGAEPVKYRGHVVIPPPLMDSGTFKDGVRARIDALASSGALPDGLTAGQLRNAALENVADGVYVFKSGDSKIIGRDGKELRLDFNQPAPPAPIGVSTQRVTGQPRSTAQEVHTRNIAELEREIGRTKNAKIRAALEAELVTERRLLEGKP